VAVAHLWAMTPVALQVVSSSRRIRRA